MSFFIPQCFAKLSERSFNKDGQLLRFRELTLTNEGGSFVFNVPESLALQAPLGVVQVEGRCTARQRGYNTILDLEAVTFGAAK